MRSEYGCVAPFWAGPGVTFASAAIGLVLPLLGLPLGDGDRRVRHLRGGVAGRRQVDALEPVVVVALGEVGAELGAPRLLALDRRDDGALRAVEHVPQLDRAEHVLVEDRAVVVDVGRLRLLLEAADR